LFIKQIKDKPILDQLYLTLEKYYADLNFLPTRMLARLYPFSIFNDQLARYSAFTIDTPNDKLFTFFQQLKFDRNAETFRVDGEVVDREQIQKISFLLRENLVYNISSSTQDEEVDLSNFWISQDPCDCARCNFERLKFSAIYQKLQESLGQNAHELLKNAYMHYQLGDFKVAFDIYKNLTEEKEKRNFNITHFISYYNLKKLYAFIRHEYAGADKEDVLREIRNIDLDKLLNQLASDEVGKEVAKWISQEEFLKQASLALDAIVLSIRSNYQLDIAGGTSQNNDVYRLISEYAEAELFLNSNYIIFDQFREFEVLTDKFIEGIIASYAIRSSESSRVQHLNDYLLRVILFYANPDSLKRLFQRYPLANKSIPISEENSFFAKVENFLSDYERLNDVFSKKEGRWDFFQNQKYNKIFQNLLILLARISIKEDTFRHIFTLLLNYLNEFSPYISRQSHATIQYFLASKHQMITLENWESLLNLAVKNPDYHKSQIIATITYFLKEDHHYQISDEALIDKLLHLSQKALDRPRRPDAYIEYLVYYARIFGPEHQEKLKDRALKAIEQMPTYWETSYIDAVLFDLIDYQSYWAEYLAEVRAIAPPIGAPDMNNPARERFHQLLSAS
ncbi:MAG: hypothetical protein HC880_03355, partial [Bacteroidia bacterium]|nr:hypothetical protein [Bacteroidia bacterium]